MRARRFTVAALASLALLVPAAASAAPRMNAAFNPDRLASATTITLGFDVGATPSPLVALAMHLPRGVTSGFNTLGVATCDLARLEAQGPSACPRNSLTGRGKGMVSVPVGTENVLEPVAISVFMAPAQGSATTLIFYVEGVEPVISQLVFRGSELGDAAPYGALIDTQIPEVAGLPGSPPAEFMSMQTELGPKGLRYTKKVNGKTVSFTPEGFDVPSTCPAGGFPFAADFSFADGTHEEATTKVSCPR